MSNTNFLEDFLSSEPVVTIHCLAALDLGTGVEQPFSRLINQICQIGHLRPTWSTVCSSAPHSQALERTIFHLCKQERKHPTPVRRRLSRTGVPVSGTKVRSHVVLPNHSTFQRRSSQNAALLILSRELMSCCAAGTNECVRLRWCAFPLGGQVSAEWSRCPRSIARRVRENVVPLRRSLAGWKPANIWRLSAGVRRRHLVTIRKVSLMAGSVMRVWALRYLRGAQYSCCWSMTVRNVVAPTPHPESASSSKSATRDVNFLRSAPRCRRCVSDLSNVTPRYLGSEHKGRFRCCG